MGLVLIISVLGTIVFLGICALQMEAYNTLIKCKNCHMIARVYQNGIQHGFSNSFRCVCGSDMDTISDNAWTKKATEFPKITFGELKSLRAIRKQQQREALRQEELDSYQKWMAQWGREAGDK